MTLKRYSNGQYFQVFFNELSGDQIDHVQKGINDRLSGQTKLFNDSLVKEYVEQIYQHLINEKKD